MKRIAIIGCSHSSYDQVHHGPSKDGRDWIHHISTIAKEFEFHSFAAEGHGPLYYDYVLKQLVITYPADFFDAIIVQYTVGGRWFFPLDSEKFRVDWVNQNSILDFTPEQLSENYTYYRLMAPRISMSRNKATAWNVNRYEKKSLQRIKQSESDIDDIYEPDGMVTRYEENFTKLLIPLYKQFFNNIFCFDFSNTMFNAETVDSNFKYRNNIGQVLPFKNFITEKYGIEHVAMHLFDSSFHCSNLGNILLVEDYLANSNLGDYLNIRGKKIQID
jgi:hypothetical protein